MACRTKLSAPIVTAGRDQGKERKGRAPEHGEWVKACPVHAALTPEAAGSQHASTEIATVLRETRFHLRVKAHGFVIATRSRAAAL